MNAVAIFGGSKLGEGTWRPGSEVNATAVFGGVELDFRHAELEQGVTKVSAVAVLGGVKIIVPPGLPITMTGFSILGGRELKRSAAKEPTPSPAKTLQINAVSVLGGVSVTEEP